MAYRNIWKAEETDSGLHLREQLLKLGCRSGPPRQWLKVQAAGHHLPSMEVAGPALPPETGSEACPRQPDTHHTVKAPTAFTARKGNVARIYVGS